MFPTPDQAPAGEHPAAQVNGIPRDARKAGAGGRRADQCRADPPRPVRAPRQEEPGGGRANAGTAKGR